MGARVREVGGGRGAGAWDFCCTQSAHLNNQNILSSHSMAKFEIYKHVISGRKRYMY